MPKSCCIRGCSTDKCKNPDLHFYVFPKNERRRQKWLDAINEAFPSGDGTLWEPKSVHTYICSAHFITGQKVNIEPHPDFVPSIFPTSLQQPSAYTEASWSQSGKPSKDPQHPDYVPSLRLDGNDGSPTVSQLLPLSASTPQLLDRLGTMTHEASAVKVPASVTDVAPEIGLYLPEASQSEQEEGCLDQGIQTDMNRHQVSCLEQEVVNLRTANVILINQVTGLNMYVKRQQEDLDRYLLELKTLRKLHNADTELS